MRKRRPDGRFLAGPRVGAKTALVEKEGGVANRVSAPRARGCRTYTRNRVAEALPDIVETFVRKAKAGSVAHARALASLGGLDKGDVVEPPRPRGKSLGRRLSEELDRAKARAAERVRKAEEREAKAKEAKEAEQREVEQREAEQNEAETSSSEAASEAA